jgi:hypothetical protein
MAAKAAAAANLRWVPGPAHSHTYFLQSGADLVGEVRPNTQHYGATWLALVGRKPVGTSWSIQEARELVEESYAHQ